MTVRQSRFTFHFALGATVSAWLLALLVVGAELAPAFKEWLKAVFWHHWIGKVAVTLGAFIVVGMLFSRARIRKIFSVDVDRAAWWSVLGSLAAILLFYIWAYFG